MPNFQFAKIYKISCNDALITDCYIGQTCNFQQRLNEHRSNCYNQNSNKYNYKLYQTIRANGGFDNWTMNIIELYPCNNKLESSAREKHHYLLHNSTLNDHVPNQTQAEYYQNVKDILNAKNKCACGGKFTTQGKSLHIKTVKHMKYQIEFLELRNLEAEFQLMLSR
jgi:hypothetical protein